MAIEDAYNRQLNYARISVTDRCNLRCRYCMPQEGVPWIAHDDIMSYEDITFLCRALSQLGVQKFRFTGGEPLVRKGFADYLKDFRTAFHDIKISLTTNAILLSKYAKHLAKLDLNGLNVSLDTLDAQKFFRLSGGGDLSQVLQGLSAAKECHITPIKLNMVLMRGTNDGEVGAVLDYATKCGFLLRLIEFMPLENSLWSEDKFISGREILEKLGEPANWQEIERKDFYGPARYFVNAATAQEIGIISSVSEHFCSSCNRIRISAQGKLKTCLFSEHETPLAPLIRARDNDALKAAILNGAYEKPKCWEEVQRGSVKMSRIGG